MNRQEGDTPRDEAWLEDLFRRHHAAVRTYCARRLGASGDDVVSEVFAVAWRKREVVPDRPLPWLYAVAARELLHLQRSEGRRAGHEGRAAARRDERADPFTAVDDRLSAQAPISAAMGRLRPTDAEILRLWAWEELSATEIAVVLDISATTARVRLHRARLRLKVQLHAMDLHLSQEPRQPFAHSTSSSLAPFEPPEPCHD
ncbi:RNA polymerase sigma factor [Nocardioides gilvus]|uniref:RNA polymerase sigma factor n=1 Tax=Nocardioides gilvus TaxID=1735589 RepID=UPI000D745030|nr:RNA polymerase sigma factor [Nocardioides gilvus]